MRTLRLVIVFITAFATVHLVSAQSEQERIDKARASVQQAQQIKSKAKLDSAVRMTDAGMYAEADASYLQILKNLKSVPSDFTWHFGRNSYHLGKYSQSVDWINKYLQLKGTAGEFSEAATALLKDAERELLRVRNEQAAAATIVLSRNYDIDCGPSGKVTCPVCSGSTVVVKKSYLGDTYKTCTVCTKGTIDCAVYNKMLRGEK